MHRLHSCLVYNSDQNNLGQRKKQIWDVQEKQNIHFSVLIMLHFPFWQMEQAVKLVRKHKISEKYLLHNLKITEVKIKKNFIVWKKLFCSIHNNNNSSKIAKIKKSLLHFLSLINLNEKCWLLNSEFWRY